MLGPEHVIGICLFRERLGNFGEVYSSACSVKPLLLFLRVGYGLVGAQSCPHTTLALAGLILKVSFPGHTQL